MPEYYNVLLWVAGIFAVTFSIFHLTMIEIVKAKSLMYRELVKINKKYALKVKLEKRIEILERCKTKNFFDKRNFEDVLIDDIEKKIEYYDRVISTNEKAYTNYRDYIKEYNPIHPEFEPSGSKWNHFKQWLFHKYERYVYQGHKLPAYRYTKAMVSKSYTSPQGKVTKMVQHLYSYDGLKSKYDLVKRELASRTERQNLIKLERAKITPSLRADILRRDNYTCQHCGRTQKDGVMLHVDHIVPVSLGGKTDGSNLQTLCEDCNKGKSNRFIN